MTSDIAFPLLDELIYFFMLSFSSVVKLSYGCEVTFMKVCAESRDSTSARRMFCVLLTVPLGDAPPTDACVGSTATTVAI